MDNNSILQSSILSALPAKPDRPIWAAEIFKRLGVARPTPSQRASLSRSLARLAKRGLVHAYQPERCRAGHGHLWAKPVVGGLEKRVALMGLLGVAPGEVSTRAEFEALVDKIPALIAVMDDATRRAVRQLLQARK